MNARRLLQDEGGQATLLAATLAYVPFLLLVTLVIFVAMAGFRQIGTAALAHLAARQAGIEGLSAGEAMAVQHGEVWNVPGKAARLQVDPARRSVGLAWEYEWQSQTLAGRLVGAFQIAVQELERKEQFYAGPPDGWE